LSAAAGRGEPRASQGGRLQLLVASFNPGKARELADLVAPLGCETVGLASLGIDTGYEESGTSYEENAVGKARHYAALSGLVTVADDSGIEVDALGGRPGILSARYGGAGLDDAGRCRLMLSELDGVPEERRGARYVAVAVIARPDGEARTFRGTCEGRITTATRGSGGFGYDPLFFFPEFGATFAEVAAERKHGVSHRGAALRALTRFLAADEGARFLGPPGTPTR
jgi:XTP/dITP diphosphohydrolase